MFKQILNKSTSKFSIIRLKYFKFAETKAEMKETFPPKQETKPIDSPSGSTPGSNIKSERLSQYKEVIEGFNKDWKKVVEEKDLHRIKRIRDELTPSQRKFIEILAGKLASLNFAQINYVFNKYNERLDKIKTISPLSVNPQWLDLQKDLGGKIPNDGARFTDHEELMKNWAKWYQSQIPGFGVGEVSAPQATTEKKEVKKEEKKEEVQEKSAYDLELTSFDAAKKIALIKEVRAALNLGLKEAKEMVEKAPVVLMKGVKKADSEELVKKLKDNGGVVTLK